MGKMKELWQEEQDKKMEALDVQYQEEQAGFTSQTPTCTCGKKIYKAESIKQGLCTWCRGEKPNDYKSIKYQTSDFSRNPDNGDYR